MNIHWRGLWHLLSFALSLFYPMKGLTRDSRWADVCGTGGRTKWSQATALQRGRTHCRRYQWSRTCRRFYVPSYHPPEAAFIRVLSLNLTWRRAAPGSQPGTGVRECRTKSSPSCDAKDPSDHTSKRASQHPIDIVEFGILGPVFPALSPPSVRYLGFGHLSKAPSGRIGRCRGQVGEFGFCSCSAATTSYGSRVRAFHTCAVLAQTTNRL